MIVLEFPMRTHSTNVLRTRHWRVNSNEAAQQKRIVFAEFNQSKSASMPSAKLRIPSPPLIVTLTRLGIRALDSDNLAGSFKAVRDQVAKEIGVDDGSGLVTWNYKQEKSKTYRVRIEIEERV